MERETERENENLEQLPEAIIDRLRGEEQSISIISPKIDQIILAEAKSHFAAREPAKSRTLTRPAWAAIAASTVLAILVMSEFYIEQSVDISGFMDTSRFLDPLPAPGFFADVDNSGRLDIVDVLALARRHEGNPAAVSQAQIDALMMKIVSLSENGDTS